MDDAQHAALQAYARSVADGLLLRDWEVEVFRETCDDDYMATVAVSDVENHAGIRVNKRFFGESPAYQREIMAHELCHCHTDRVKRCMVHLNEEHATDVSRFAAEMQRKELEILVQKMARVLAPTLPLPDLPPGVNY